MNILNRVKDTSTTTGTGTITVSGSPANTYQAFSNLAVGDVAPICIAHQSANEWEVVRGVMASGTTFTRAASDVLDGSSGPGVLVNFSAGTKDVFVVDPASLAKRAGQGRALVLARGLTTN